MDIFINEELNYFTNRTTDVLNISKEYLNMAGEMFMYLNICPHMKSWMVLYLDLLENNPIDVVIHTLNRIIKRGRDLGEETSVDIAKNMLMFIAKRFSLQFQTVDLLTRPKTSSVNLSNTLLDKGNLRKTNILLFSII